MLDQAPALSFHPRPSSFDTSILAVPISEGDRRDPEGIERELLNLPDDGQSPSFAGAMRKEVEEAQKWKQMLLILAAAIVAIYIVLGVLYESYFHPTDHSCRRLPPTVHRSAA